MDISPEEQFKKDMRAVLRKIKEQILYYPEIKGVFFYSSPIWDDVKIVENQMLKQLKNMGAIQKLKYNSAQNTSFFEINEPQFNDIYQLFCEQENDKIGRRANSIVFDQLNSVLTEGEKRHAFQKGNKGERIRLLLFNMLWENRKCFKSGKETRSGQIYLPSYYAIQLNLCSEVRGFDRDKNIQKDFFNVLKGINRIFREKRFSAKIKRKNGLQLVIAEKR